MPRVPTRTTAETQLSAPRTRPASPVFQNVRGATAEAFGAAEGRAVAQVGAAVQVEAERQFRIEGQIQSRRNTLDRLKRKEALSAELFTLSNQVSTEQDVTDPRVLGAFGQKAGEVTQRHVNELQALGTGEDNEIQFAVMAQGVVSGFRDQLAKQSVAATEGLVKIAQEKAVNELAAEASAQPGGALLLMSEGVQQRLVEMDGLLRQDQEGFFIVDAQAAIARNAIDEYFSRGDAESVALGMDLLEHPEVQKVIPPAARRTFLSRSSQISDPPRILPASETADKFRMSLEEAQGFIVEQDKTGFTVHVKPTAGEKLRADQIEQYQAQGMTPERATDVVDGRIKWSVIEKTGEVVEFNERTGETLIRKKARPSEDTLQAAPERENVGLFQRVQATPTSGLAPAVVELMVDTLGQIPGLPVPDFAKDIVSVRQDILAARNTMLQAFALNDRYPVALVKLIIQDTNMETNVFKSDRALVIRMVSVAKSLQRRIVREQAIAEDLNQGINRREVAATAVADMSNFLDELNVPKDFDPLVSEESPTHILNDDQYDALPSGTNYFGPDGVHRVKP